MPRGDKSKSTQKQKRQASSIQEGYEGRSVPRKEAASRALVTVTKEASGSKKAGVTGRGKQASSAGRGKTQGRQASSQRGRMSAAGGSSARRSGARKPASKKSTQSRSSGTSR